MNLNYCSERYIFWGFDAVRQVIIFEYFKGHRLGANLISINPILERVPSLTGSFALIFKIHFCHKTHGLYTIQAIKVEGKIAERKAELK